MIGHSKFKEGWQTNLIDIKEKAMITWMAISRKYKNYIWMKKQKKKRE